MSCNAGGSQRFKPALHVVLGTHRQNGTGRAADDMLRRRSKYREVHTTSSLRAHNNELGVFRLCRTQYLAIRASEHDRPADLSPGARLVGDQTSHTLISLRRHVAAIRGAVEVRGNPWPLFDGRPFDDVQQRDFPVGLPGEVKRNVQRLNSRRREVNRTQDARERRRVR